MWLAGAGLSFMGFVLHISGAHGQVNSLCALRGSSVELPCTKDQPTVNMSYKSYTLHYVDQFSYSLSNFSADGNRTQYNMSLGSNLTISDLRESDANVYCCGSIADVPQRCWYYRTELLVGDLQVKVIPTEEEQRVTLMCSISCPLTETPEAYIWYKNGEFLYDDWSPWYQELVGSDEAVGYSCAIKGREDLRAPEVSVDSITSTCLGVTYAGGRMCSLQQKPEDRPCSITFPREISIQRTQVDEEYTRLTCTPSCPLTDSNTTYRWYEDKHLYKLTQSQNLMVPHASGFLCALKGHEDLHAPEVCSQKKFCETLNYPSRRICALEGSSVNISSVNPILKNSRLGPELWYKVKRRGKEVTAEVVEATGRVEYHNESRNHHVLRIHDLKRNDSAEYSWRRDKRNNSWRRLNFPGVTLVVSGLRVLMTPSAAVNEGQRVTLTCSTSCPLGDKTTYTWHLDGRRLTPPGSGGKRLVLDPVGCRHAGSYSCAVNGTRSPGKTLAVRAPLNIIMINAIRLASVLLIPILLLLFWLRTRWMHRASSRLM